MPPPLWYLMIKSLFPLLMNGGCLLRVKEDMSVEVLWKTQDLSCHWMTRSMKMVFYMESVGVIPEHPSWFVLTLRQEKKYGQRECIGRKGCLEWIET